ncbi:hypothetical protein [Nocardia alni]|uniref:hypothetical protein n=1 Tax=Nocardia alni TaxID=2815723 RepID=UPI001C24CCBF|nr:hypothetical protein [Nocardia alni]
MKTVYGEKRAEIAALVSHLPQGLGHSSLGDTSVSAQRGAGEGRHPGLLGRSDDGAFGRGDQESNCGMKLHGAAESCGCAAQPIQCVCTRRDPTRGRIEHFPFPPLTLIGAERGVPRIESEQCHRQFRHDYRKPVPRDRFPRQIRSDTTEKVTFDVIGRDAGKSREDYTQYIDIHRLMTVDRGGGATIHIVGHDLFSPREYAELAHRT